MAKLSTPRIRIVLAPGPHAVPGVDEGIGHELQVLNMDMVAFDRERARFKWPGADEAPMLWATYLAWRVAVRNGITPGLSLGEFEQTAWQVAVVPDDESTEDDAVDPTRTGHGPG